MIDILALINISLLKGCVRQYMNIIITVSNKLELTNIFCSRSNHKTTLNHFLNVMMNTLLE